MSDLSGGSVEFSQEAIAALAQEVLALISAGGVASLGEVAPSMMIEELAGRLPEKVTMSLLDACNIMVGNLERRLLEKRSELLETFATWTIPTTGTYELPAKFLGFTNNPVYNGKELQPVVGNPLLLTGQPLTPRWYKILGTSLAIFPPPAADISVSVSYQQGINTISAITEALPLSRYFARYYVEGALMTLAGLMAPLTPEFELFTKQTVDSVLFSRGRNTMSLSMGVM